MRKRLPLFIIICSCFVSCASPPRVTYNRVANLQNYSPIAVLEFEPPAGSYGMKAHLSGKVISDYFEMILPMGRFKVVNRRNLREVLNEKRFQMSGLTEDSAMRIGKMVGARSVLVGQVTNYGISFNLLTACDFGYDISFMCKLLDVETGNILYAGASILRGCGSFEQTSEQLVDATVRKMTGYRDQ